VIPWRQLVRSAVRARTSVRFTTTARPLEPIDGDRGGPVLWCSLECTPACQAGGRGFKSRQDRCPFGGYGRVAQLVERAPEKREVAGSMPAPTTDGPTHPD
jgi:hypothetical protein